MQSDPVVKDTSSHENVSRNCSPSPESGPNQESGNGAEPVMRPSQEALCLPNLRHLVLNATGLGWTGVAGLLGMFQDLEELHLSLNGYTTVDLPEDLRYPSLRRLFFSKNPISSWAEWSKLGRAFPGLQLLFMADTEVDHLGEESSIATAFPVLEVLSLNRTLLGSWTDIDKLRLFPMLRDVRLQGIPFLESYSPEDRRCELLARLPGITQLNGSTVTEGEHQSAERDFLKLYVLVDEKPARFYELLKVYGEQDPSTSLTNISPQPPVSVMIRMGKRTHVTQAYPSQTLLDFKRSLESWTEMTPSRFVLIYRNKQAPPGVPPQRLKDLDTTIRDLRVHDGDEFFIEMKSHLE